MAINVFHEVLFPSPVMYGMSGGAQFNTYQEQENDGGINRSPNWDNELRRYNIDFVSVDQSAYNELNSFFLARKGARAGFRFLDYADYYVQNQYIGAGDGTTKIFQLKKIYNEHYVESDILTSSSSVITFKEVDSGLLTAGNVIQLTNTPGGTDDGYYTIQLVSSSPIYPVSAVSMASKTITLDADYSSEFYRFQTITINGSTGNDGEYTVLEVGLSAGNTILTVQETIPDATADGNVVANSKITVKPSMTSTSGKVLLFPNRDIKKPSFAAHVFPGDEWMSGVYLSVNGVAKTENIDYYINYKTGEVYFPTAPANNHRIVATKFEFHVPVSITGDWFESEYEDFQFYTGTFELIEERLT